MALRVGYGTDLHLLIPGDGLWLGGVEVPCSYAAKAHSDGDVLLHAVIDAILGACAAGDIGEHFPESRLPRGTSSIRLLADTLTIVSASAPRIVNVDCVIDLETVMLREWKPAIRAKLSSLLGIGVGQVNVKAKTAEGTGAVGEGRAISAQAVVLLDLPDGA